MLKLPRRLWHILWIPPAAFLVVGFIASFFVETSTGGSYTCITCGLCKTSESILGIERATFQRSAMTDWYERNIAQPHTHQWKFNGHEYRGTLWGRGSVACGLGKPWKLVVLALDRLKPLKEDMVLYHDLTDSDETHRHAAWKTIDVFSDKWTDEEVKDWWVKSRSYLGNPSAWGTRFE